MDQAIWAISYDLEDESRHGFLKWLHEAYLPRLAGNAAFAWVAHYEQCEAPPQAQRKPDGSLNIAHTADDVGDGEQFLLLVGANAPQAFLDPVFYDLETTVLDGAGDMLARRRGLRHALFLEQQRVIGRAPGAAAHPPFPGPIIQFGSQRTHTQDDEFYLNAFYVQNRMPFMARAADCIRTRKLVGIAGWARHGILYEFPSIAARNHLWDLERQEQKSNPSHSWSLTNRTIHAPGSPVVAKRSWPPADMP